MAGVGLTHQVFLGSGLSVQPNSRDLHFGQHGADQHSENDKSQANFSHAVEEEAPCEKERATPSHCYASSNRPSRRATYRAVCSKRATLPGKITEGCRCGRNRTTEWNVKWSAIRAWGVYHSRMLNRWAANMGRLEGATAEKAVPFPCAARRSLVVRLVAFLWFPAYAQL
jgi:hypothetical protein